MLVLRRFGAVIVWAACAAYTVGSVIGFFRAATLPTLAEGLSFAPGIKSALTLGSVVLGGRLWGLHEPDLPR
jgi:hypothetical protein